MPRDGSHAARCRCRGATAATMPVSLAALLWAATAAAPAAATADGPDHFDVAGVPPGATLTLRAGPSEDTAPVAVIGHDARALRNLGCTGGPSFGEWQRMSEAQRTQAARRRWCRVRHAGIEGWAPGVSLRESAGEPRTPGAPAPSWNELADLAYSGILPQPVRLVDGRFEGAPYAPGAASRPRVALAREPIAIGDIDGDGTADAWVLLTHDAGGSGTFLFLAAVTRRGGTLVNAGTALVGDRVDVIALSHAGGRAVLEHVAADGGDPACCPTLRVSAAYALGERGLVRVSRQPLGTLTLDRLAGVDWRLTRLGDRPPPAGGAPITARFEPGRVSGSAGCNRYFASVSAPTPYRLAIGAVGTTRRACEGPAGDTEAVFLRLLASATSYRFRLGRLLVQAGRDGAGSTLAFEPARALDAARGR